MLLLAYSVTDCLSFLLFTQLRTYFDYNYKNKTFALSFLGYRLLFNSFVRTLILIIRIKALLLAYSVTDCLSFLLFTQLRTYFDYKNKNNLCS
jgi:hypothetical protein